MKRRRSFRAQIVLSTVGISGVVLSLFALVTWNTVRLAGLQRLDREIAGDVEPQLAVEDDSARWGGFERALQMVYGGRQPHAFILLVKDAQGQVVRQSSDWPAEIAVDSFPAPLANDPRLRPASPPTSIPPPPPPHPRRAGTPDRPQWKPQGRPPGLISQPRLVTPATFSSHWGDGTHWRLGTASNGSVRVVLGLNLTRLDAEITRLGAAFALALLAALAAIAAASWVLSGRSLRPLGRLSDVAEAVTATSLDHRIPTEGTEVELLRLVTVFNEMLDRLERSFHQAVRFSADAAHELQTPLTILQGELEQALQAADNDDDQCVYALLLEEVQRLKNIVRKLLLLSRVDAGEMQPALHPVNLSQVAEAIREDTDAIAPHLALRTDLQPDVWVVADADLLQQVLANLASNAMKYNRPGGTIEITLSAEEGTARLCLTNTGPQIAPENRERVFDRFYRADPARGRDVDGVGLGLSLAREIARLHGGDVALQESTEERTVFVLTLPLAPA